VCLLFSLILGAAWSLIPMYWPFVGGLVGTISNLPWTLVSCSSYSSAKHLQKEVLCDYPVVKGAGYWAVKGVCADMQASTLSTKVHTITKTSPSLLFYWGQLDTPIGNKWQPGEWLPLGLGKGLWFATSPLVCIQTFRLRKTVMGQHYWSTNWFRGFVFHGIENFLTPEILKFNNS